jgi:hypothetical protein
MIGQRLGHYELIEKIGAGGMGEVYRARDLKLHREVALKLLPAELAKNPEWILRLTQEARSVAGLNHPNVVTLHSIEDGGERPFITMELVSGKTLDQVIGPQGLPVETLLELAVPLARKGSGGDEPGRRVAPAKRGKPALAMLVGRNRPPVRRRRARQGDAGPTRGGGTNEVHRPDDDGRPVRPPQR